MSLRVPPKTVNGNYFGQHYTLVFVPNAPNEERWRYKVIITRKFEFTGSASTEARAANDAKKMIDAQCGIVRGKATG